MYYHNNSKINSTQNIHLSNFDSLKIELRRKIMREKYSINCKLLFEDDFSEQTRAIELLRQLRIHKKTIDLLRDSNFIFNRSTCSLFRELRAYDKHKVGEFEKKFPLAFVVLVDHEVEQFERFLRTIYRPHNIYCIHVDQKSSSDVRSAIESIADCFDNVFIATRIENVYWGSNTLLKAQLNCMSDLLNLTRIINVDKHPNLAGKKPIRWRYLLNVASTFLPIRTNLELTRIFSMYNGSNDIGFIRGAGSDRYQTIWKFYSQKGEMINTQRPISSPPPHNFEVVKSSNYIAASRSFIDYVVNSKYAKDQLKWSLDIYILVSSLFHLLCQFNLQTHFY